MQAGGVSDFVCACMDGALSLHSSTQPSAADAKLTEPPSADELAATTARLAANLCTDETTAGPLARSVPLATSTLALAALHPSHRCPETGLHLLSFLCNVSYFSRVSVLPDLDHPDAGGNAFLALQLPSVLDVLLPALHHDDPDTATVAAKAIAHYARLPCAHERSNALRIAHALLPLLDTSAADLAAAAAGALTNVAGSAAGCVALAAAPVGAPLVQASRHWLAAVIRQAGNRGVGDTVASSVPQVAAAAVLQLMLNLLRWHSGADAAASCARAKGTITHSDPARKVSALEEASTGLLSGAPGEETAAEVGGAWCELGPGFWDHAGSLLLDLQRACALESSDPQHCEVLCAAHDALAAWLGNEREC